MVVASTWVFFAAVFAAGMAMTMYMPANKWDRAVALGVCGGLPILRQEDGSLWLRVSGMRTYRIEGNWKEMCR
jgi:hypothetical protein